MQAAVGPTVSKLRTTFSWQPTRPENRPSPHAVLLCRTLSQSGGTAQTR